MEDRIKFFAVGLVLAVMAFSSGHGFSDKYFSAVTQESNSIDPHFYVSVGDGSTDPGFSVKVGGGTNSIDPNFYFNKKK